MPLAKIVLVANLAAASAYDGIRWERRISTRTVSKESAIDGHSRDIQLTAFLHNNRFIQRLRFAFVIFPEVNTQ